MKDSGTSPPFLQSRGHALFEIGLVAAVVIGLIGTITACVASYQQGAQKSACIKRITEVQRGVRAYQAEQRLQAGDPLPLELKSGKALPFSTAPCCPQSGKAYVWENHIPVNGRPVVRCPHANQRGHIPSITEGW
ncbi:MAG: hypothetical protein HKN23_04320 [Verrucomicrobiales bacterium]|nr:hypothetical protein [Verrucomicrobiales bacterium]